MCQQILGSVGGKSCADKISIPPTSERPPGCYSVAPDGNGVIQTPHYNPFFNNDVGTSVSTDSRYGYICSTCDEHGVASGSDFEFVAFPGSCSGVGKCFLPSAEMCVEAKKFFGGESCYDEMTEERPDRPAGCYGLERDDGTFSNFVFNSLTDDHGTEVTGNSDFGYWCTECDGKNHITISQNHSIQRFGCKISQNQDQGKPRDFFSQYLVRREWFRPKT